jgi:hypothetical protein
VSDSPALDHPGDAGALHTLKLIEDWILTR